MMLYDLIDDKVVPSTVYLSSYSYVSSWTCMQNQWNFENELLNLRSKPWISEQYLTIIHESRYSKNKLMHNQVQLATLRTGTKK